MLNKGDLVKMNEAIKAALIANGCKAHVDEFGDCIGIVQGLTDFGTQQGPEYDVRWQPSNLRYSYSEKQLDKE